MRISRGCRSDPARSRLIRCSSVPSRFLEARDDFPDVRAAGQRGAPAVSGPA